MLHRTDLDPTSTAQHPRPQPRESPLHAPTRALLLPLKSCRTSTSQRLETGRPSSGQRAAGQGFSPRRIEQTKAEPRQFAEKSLPCAVAPRREAGRQAGRRTTKKEAAAAGGAVRQQARRRRLLGSMASSHRGEKKRRP